MSFFLPSFSLVCQMVAGASSDTIQLVSAARPVDPPQQAMLKAGPAPPHLVDSLSQNQHVPKVTITPPHLASSLSWDLHPSKATPALGKGKQPYPTAHPQQVQLGLSASSSRGWPHLPACLQQLQPHLSASHIGPIASPAHYCTCNSCSLSLQTNQLRASPTH